MRVSGISTGFPVLSRSSGQVPHVLLTRSPLSTRASPGFSFDLHVLGAPPAFVLSQDQTLHRDFNPTRIIWWSMKSESRRSGSLLPRSGNFARRPPKGAHRAELMMTCLATRPHWLLASLFRFQGATTRHRNGRHPFPQAPSRHSPLPPPLPRWAGPARSVRVNPLGNRSPGGLEILRAGRTDLQAVAPGISGRDS